MSERAVYISYARRDRHFAHQLVRDLTAAGLRVYYDDNVLKTGQVWQDALHRAIDRADSVVVILSENAVKSTGVLGEIQYARQNQKRILPVLLDNVYDFLKEVNIDELFASKIDNAADYTKVINDIVDMTQPSLQAMSSTLQERGFSNQAISALMSIARQSASLPSNALLLHYERDLTLEEILSIENAVNTTARTVLQQVPTLYNQDMQFSEAKLFHVHTVTRPGSTTLELLFAEVQQFANSPIVQAILIGLLTSVIYDIGKNQFLNAKRGIGAFFARKRGTDKLEEIKEPVPSEIPSKTYSTLTANIDIVMTGQQLVTLEPIAEMPKYVIGGDQRFLWIMESKPQSSVIEATGLTYFDQLEQRVAQYQPLDD